MKTLTSLLVVCAGTSAQFAPAQDQLSLAARYAPPAQRMHRSCVRGCNRVGAESSPASRSTRTRCLIDANRPPVWLRTQVIAPRPVPLRQRPAPLAPLPIRRLLPQTRLLGRAFLRPPKRNRLPHPKPLHPNPHQPKVMLQKAIRPPREKSS